MYKVRWVSMRMFQERQIGLTYTLTANLVCFQSMVYFEKPSDFHTTEISIFMETAGSYFSLYQGFLWCKRYC